MTIESLTEALINLPKHESRAVRIMRQQREQTGQLYPPIESKVECVRLVNDLVATGVAATKLCESLSRLSPIPLKDAQNTDIDAWCLL